MKNNLYQKLIPALVIISIIVPTILFSGAKVAEAIPVIDWFVGTTTGLTAGSTTTSAGANVTQTAFTIKNFAKDIARQVLMTVAKRALQQMTKSTVNWINSGFHGSPLFVENPKSFFRDIAKFEVKNLVDTFGYDSARFPFGKQFALNTIDSYKRQLEDNTEYTLSRVIDDPALLERYRNDFNVGGWNGFLLNTQYPQNNYPGFQMLATEELARRIEGTSQNAAQTVQTTLQQGMGFLSPQTCPSNPAYNNVSNEFHKPTFNYDKIEAWDPPSACEDIQNFGTDDPEYYEKEQICNDYTTHYNNRKEKAQNDFTRVNTCPKGLVNTTPGSVVANQITTAMGSSFRQTELGAAMGNSLSAIFDALLNKFIGSGLNALASTVNPKPEPDNWTYDGRSLGSPDDSANSAWDAGPDEEVILSEFKKVVQDGIDNTNIELKLISNDVATVNNPLGITQYLGLIWPKTRELDICLPGPDIGWEKRADEEMERNASKLQEKSDDDDPEEAARAKSVFQELKFAVNFFKDWINNKMLIELPNSILYMDAVTEIETIYQQSDELIDQRRLKNSALARLNSINIALANFTIQPTPGSGGEKALIALKKQYNAISDTVSNTASIENTKNELNIAIEKYNNLGKLITQCNAERLATQCNKRGFDPNQHTKAYWTVPGGGTSSCGLPKDPIFRGGTVDGVEYNSEQALFCSSPIYHGYNHESFDHKNDGASQDAISYPEVPYVNAKKVFNYDKAIGSGDVDIEINCGYIYKANVLDYKKNIPGLTGVVEPYQPTPDPNAGTNAGTNLPTATPPACVTPMVLQNGQCVLPPQNSCETYVGQGPYTNGQPSLIIAGPLGINLLPSSGQFNIYDIGTAQYVPLTYTGKNTSTSTISGVTTASPLNIPSGTAVSIFNSNMTGPLTYCP